MPCWIRILVGAFLFKAGIAFGAAQPWVTSAPMTLDLVSGVRESSGVETVTYDSTWQGGSAAYKITVNDVELASRSGCGEIAWQTRRPGVYAFKASAYEDGVLTGEPLTATFRVPGRDLVDATVTFQEARLLADGTHQMPRPQVKLGDKVLTEGVDYTLSYEDNVEPGVGKVILTGIGGYQDEIERTFVIIPTGQCALDLVQGVRAVAGTERLAYDGAWLGSAEAESRISVNGALLTTATGAGTVAWSPLAAGDYALVYKTVVDGMEQTETYTAQFYVTSGDVPLDVDLGLGVFLFEGGAVTPRVTVRYRDAVLTEGVDYDLAFIDNDKAGVAKVRVTGKGAYFGTIEKTFRILPSASCALDLKEGVRVIAGTTAEAIAYENLWSGSDSSTVKVSVNDAMVVANGVAGTYDWTPDGVGLFTLTHATYDDGVLGDVLSAQFYVPGSLAEAEVSLDGEDFLFDGTARCPSVVVTVGGKVLTEGLDYTLSYEDNVAAGTAKVIVSGVAGERIVKTFTIRPAGGCFLDIAAGAREAASVETLAYDARWQGVARADYKMWVDGAELSQGSGCGDVVWTPRAVGEHVLTYRAYVNGVKVGDDLSARFHVAGRDLVHADISFVDEKILQDGTAKTPNVRIVYDGRVLTEGVDYELSYRDNVSPGTGVATITGKGAFVDIVDVPFTIVPAGGCFLDIKDGYRLAKADELLSYDFQWHGATADNTRMQVRVNDAIFGEVTGIGDLDWHPTVGGEYVVNLRTYVDNYLQEDAVETAHFGIPGGDLNDWTLTIMLEPGVYLYDGQPKTPKVTAKTPLGELVEGVDFTVSYRNNVDVGVATAILSGCGLYSGQVERPFRIVAPFALARQRYPWNGKVDIELDVQDAQLNACAVTLAARDGVGGTNLPVETVLLADMTKTNATWTLSAGKIRLIWDADADIKNDCVLSNVVLEARIVDSSSLPNGYSLANGVCTRGALALDLQHYPVTMTDVTSRTITYGFQSGKRWTKDTANKKTGTHSYKTYKIGDNTSTYLTATVKGKGTFSFWWKVSSEANYDYLHYYVNNAEKGKISGTKDWAKVTIPVTSTGNTVIKWTYTKDERLSSGNDCGWVNSTWAPQTVIVTNMPSSWEKFIPESEWGPTRTVTKRQALAYSTLWEPSAGEGAQSEILLDGAGWRTNVGEGVEVWRPEALGTYEFTHRILSSGASVGKALKARFIVAGLEPPEEVAFPEGAVSVSGFTGKYDGVAHGVTVAVREDIAGATVKYATAADGVFVAEPPNLIDAGTLTVWCEIAALGYITQTNSATVTILPRAVTLTSGSASKVYDGTPLTAGTVAVGGDGFADGEGATFDVTGAQTVVGTSANTFAYSLNDGTKAGNYEIATACGTLTVTKATVGGGGEEPGGGEVPEGGVSKFDATAMYDGAGHTIDTNALVAAFGAAMAGGKTRVFYGRAAAGAAATGQGQDADTGADAGQGLAAATEAESVADWREVAPAFTNAGEYAVWYKVTNPNYEDFVHCAKVTITKRAVTLTSGSARKVYDGTPLTAGTVAISGDGFVDGEGATYDVTGSQTAVGTSANTFAYSLNDGTKAGNYEIATVHGTLTVTKATVGPGGGDEPGGGEVPAGGVSKFDAIAPYDGEGHTIDTNALAVAFGATMAGAGETRVFYGCAAAGAAATGQGLDADAGADAGQGLGAATGAESVADWREVAPAFTNAGEHAVWYKVTNPNYEDFVHAAKVTITKRPVTVTSADGHWTYDGQVHANATVTTDGFVDGEGIVARAFAEIRDVGVRPNAFEYAFADGTLAANYAVTCVTGALSVAAADMAGWTDEAKWSVTLVGDGATYDGAEKTCSVAALSYDGLAISTFTVSGNVATDAGAYTLVVAGAGNFVGTRAVPWSIRPRRVTLAAPTRTKAYDGTPLTFGADEIAVGGDGFVSGECFGYFDFASIIDVGEISATFSYRDSETAKASNYAVTILDARTLTVTNRSVTVAVTGHTATFTYDGVEKRVAGYDLATADALYAPGVDTTFGGTAEAVRTDAGTTAMGLSAADFMNKNANFDVTYQVTDGGVTIAPLDIAAVEGGAFVLGLGANPKYNGTEQTVAVLSATCRGLPVTFTLTGASATHAGDYTLTLTGTGNFTGSRSAGWRILPRAVTLTSGSARKVYDGTPLTAGTVAVGGDGFADGEGATFDVTGSQTAVGTSENTFAYSLNDGTKAGNYEIATVYGTLTVTKATVGPGGGDEPGGGEVPAGGVSKFDAIALYDGEGHTIDTNALAVAFGATMAGAGETRVFYGCAAAGAAATGQGLDADTGADAGQGLGVGLAAATGAESVADWREVAPAFTNAGEYAIWYKVTNPNYEDFVHAAKVTITKRPVTVTVVGRTAAFTYDTTAKRVAGYDLATSDTLYDPDADTAFGGAAEAVRTDAGTTAMGLSAADFANGNANFDVAYRVADGWVKIEPRVIGDDPANWDIRLGRATRYDGAEHEAPIIQVCYVKPDGNLDNVPYTLSGHTATDAGNYTVRIAGTGNYAGSVEKEWSITPRSVTLASGSAVWTYDGAPHREASVAVGGDGFADGEGATYSGFPTVAHVADAATPQANTFAYALNANTKARNYEIATAHGTVQMTPRALTLTAPTKTKTYDGAPLTFGADEVAVGGDGYAAGEAFTLGGFASLTEAGRVDAAFTVSDGTARRDDYAVTTVFGTLTVARNATEIAVTAKSGSWVYDGEAHALHDYEATNLGALLAGDALAVAFDEASAVTTPVDGPNGDGVVANALAGVRVMRGDRDVTRNYTLAVYPGTLRVTRRPVTLTSKSDTKAYDGTPLVAHEVTVGGDGFVGSDGATYAFTGSQTEKGTSKNAFTYALKGGTDAAFYEIATVEGDLTVTAADISAGAEDDWNIVLGPALAYTGLEQVQTLASVTYKGLALDCSVSGNQQTDAGAYRMTLTGQGNFTGERTVGWTIAPKPLTLTAGGGSRTYDGTAFRVGAVTAAGFVAGEGAAYVCDGAQTDVGSSGNAVATILWNVGTKASNYAVTKEPGTLTVTPRPVTLTAANLAKPYDGTPLALTAADIAAEGLVAGESFVYSDFASRTEAGQTPATFAYAAGAGTKLANYAVTVTPGRTLTVTRSATAISVTAASESWVYDGAPHSNRTWTATNLSTLQPGDALEVTFDEASVVTTPQDGPNGDGVVANVLTGVRVLRNGADDVTANYTVEGFPGTLAVTKRPVTVAVAGHTATHTYDGAEKRVAGYDISTADALYDPGADTTFGGAVEAVRTDVGTTAMGLSAADFANCNANFDVTYRVTDGGVTIAPLDIAAVEDGAFILELGSNPKYNGTVQTVPVARVMCNGLDVAYTLAGENATHAGAYVLTVKGTGNFAGERSTMWRMLPRRVTLTSGSARKVYDGTALVNAQVAVSGDGFIGLEGAVFDVTGAQTSAGTSKNTFSYALKAGTQAGDYEIEAVEGDLTVTKATYPGQEPGGAGIAWSVAADAATWVYDGQAHGVTLTGVPAGVTARLAGNAATDAGDYVATAALDYDAANYEPPAAPAPLAWSITPRPITLMAASKEKPYDGFPLAVRPGDITASGRGYAPGECFDYFGFASLTDVGEIPATFGYRDSATAKVANYAVTVVGGQTLKVTVGGDQISVTAGSETWAYDGAEHRAETWSVHNGDKLLEGHALQVAIDPASVVRTPKDGPDGDGVVSNRFASVRVVETATGADRTRNYSLVLCEGVLRVTNACIRAERLAGTADVEKTYDGAATQAVVTAALLQPAAVRYAAGAALPADGWSAEPPSFVHAGTQTVWYAVSADYYEPYTNSLRVAVAPRPVTLATPTKAKTYDGAPLTFGADEVAVGGDGCAPGESFALSDFASLSDAGRIAARCAYAAGAGTRLADYAVAEAWGTLTVLASADEITVTAADGSWPYDGTAHVRHDYAAENADTLRPGDELVVAFAPESVVLTPEDGPNGDGVVSNVVASVRVVRNGFEDVTRNYSLAWYPGTLRVTKARIAFDREGSVDPSAFSTSSTYDGAGHTAAVVPPALLTDPVTVRYGASADAVALEASPAFTNAGVHTVFYTLDAPYYETYAGTATVTIAPRPVTLVSAGAEKVYDGTPLRADAVRVKEGSPGFVGDEGFAASCRGALTDVGVMENLFDYALTGGALAGNYAVSKEYGWLRVTPATLDPGAVFGGGETDAEGRLVCARVYNGAPQPFAPAVDFGEPYRLLYATVAGDEGAYAEAAPTRTHVAEGDLVVFFKFTSPNYAPYYGTGVLRIAPKALTEEMVVADEDAAWFFDGTEKKPSVTVVDGSPNIAAADDWTVAYSDRTGAGLFPVTVTGRNDYRGAVTKEFAILKRPVAPPVIPSRTYSGRLQRPSVPEDARWTVVANPGGTDAGDYTNVVLRLASPADYRWKGLGEDETDWTGVFTVRRGANGWSVYPLIRSWTNGVDAAGAPAGRPRFGTLSVAYRRRGAPVAEESPERPSAPGRYTARFWAEETANYAGVALAAPYEVDFEIYPGPDDPPAGAATATTPVPVPHAWLGAYVARFGAGDYEAAANAVGANGVALWESYVAGLDPADAASRFTAAIAVDADGVAHVTWSPDLSAAEPPRTYTVYGKAGLGDAAWTPVTDANRARMRFFRVQVELK